jgi:hypothetical protein
MQSGKADLIAFFKQATAYKLP